MIYEIVILAMIAAFLGLRLYSVLGRRAEHEEEPIPHRFDAGETGKAPKPVVPPGQQTARPQRRRIAPNRRRSAVVHLYFVPISGTIGTKRRVACLSE